jgi:hypothetical protein
MEDHKLAQAVTTLGDLSEMLADAEARLESLDNTVPKKEQSVLRAAHHNLRNAHCMLVGAKWMLENHDDLVANNNGHGLLRRLRRN